MDALILNVGLTFEIEDTKEKRNQLQLSITKAKSMIAEVERSKHQPLYLIYGGYLTEPADFEEFPKRLPIHGYAGGSVFDRFPVLESVILKVKSFKLISVLVESEFFGYEKGAFTGATHRKQGKFKLAHRGPLFLMRSQT